MRVPGYPAAPMGMYILIHLIFFSFVFLEGLRVLQARGSLTQWQVCDALRYPGLHVRYNDIDNEFIQMRKHKEISESVS